MIDIKYIEENGSKVEKNALNKGYKIDVQKLLHLNNKRTELLKEVEDLRRERNQLSQIKNGQRLSDQDLEKAKSLKVELSNKEEILNQVEDEFSKLMLEVPNIALDDVPIGSSEDENVVYKEVGEIPKFNFEPKTHYDIAEENDWLDKKRAAKVSGSRFNYLKGSLVYLQFALVQFTINTLGNQKVIQEIIQKNNLDLDPKPFTPVIPPALIKTEVYRESARLDAKNVTYKLEDDDLWLNASAEHSLCTMYKNEILDIKDLPIRYLGYSTSFRREAGSYGKDIEGMFRSHQFDKLEMEVFSTPETGISEHLLLIALQEYLMNQLGISYRVLNKCTADVGFPNARGVDIEAWIPSQNKYRETHSADFMTDFQARRLKTRLKREDGSIDYVHTNDATAIVLSRIPIAIIENFQDEKGRVKIPEVLKPYIQNREYL